MKVIKVILLLGPYILAAYVWSQSDIIGLEFYLGFLAIVWAGLQKLTMYRLQDVVNTNAKASRDAIDHTEKLIKDLAEAGIEIDKRITALEKNG